ncbi:hypothetical protein [Kitasatospora sp. NPDC093806]|uniref:hypothetical protein n=1 Tax=Kitasatospora sp. NPDC093806 TaxID=3155075 RepID=UPI00344A7925
MGKFRKALAGLVIAGTAVLAVPGVAQADGGCGWTNFCAYSDDYGYTYQNAGNSGDWPYQVKNKVDWVGNNGAPGGRDKVNIYWGTAAENYGAYACIGYGTSWNLRGNGYHYSWTRGGDSRGLGESVHDNAASHSWVYSCGNNTW